YDAAIREYRLATELDETLVNPHLGLGRVFLLQEKFQDAIPELEQAEHLSPTDSHACDLLGRALEGSGNLEAAVAEFRQAALLAPKDTEIRMRLAAALEKKGDWPAAITQYRKASSADRGRLGATLDAGGKSVIIDPSKPDPQIEYQRAQERLKQHLISLRAAGKSSEAANIEGRIIALDTPPNLEDLQKAAMRAGDTALGSQQFQEAETSFQEAIKLAEKIQPQDGRLPEAVERLGAVYFARLDYPRAQERFQQQLALTEKLYGA